MPADASHTGDIFGGWVLSRMDQAGGIAGVERARRPSRPRWDERPWDERSWDER